MNVKEVKAALENFNDTDLVTVLLHMGTTYRVDGCQIEPIKRQSDLYEVRSIKKDDIEDNAIVLKIE